MHRGTVPFLGLVSTTAEVSMSMRRRRRREPRRSPTTGDEPGERPINDILDALAQNKELEALLACTGDDPRFLALLERVRRVFAIPGKGEVVKRVRELSRSQDRTPAVDAPAVTPSASSPTRDVSSAPRAHEDGDRLGPVAAYLAREAPGFFYAPVGPTGETNYYEQTAPETRGAMELWSWIHEQPSVIDSMAPLDDFEERIAELLDSDTDYFAVCLKVQTVRAALASLLRDPPTKNPRGRRALLHLSEQLTAVFPDLGQGVPDEVVHLIGEEFGVADLDEAVSVAEEEAGFAKERKGATAAELRDLQRQHAAVRLASAADRSDVRRRHVGQWRRDAERGPR